MQTSNPASDEPFDRSQLSPTFNESAQVGEPGSHSRHCNADPDRHGRWIVGDDRSDHRDERGYQQHGPNDPSPSTRSSNGDATAAKATAKAPATTIAGADQSCAV